MSNEVANVCDLPSGDRCSFGVSYAGLQKAVTLASPEGYKVAWYSWLQSKQAKPWFSWGSL